MTVQRSGFSLDATKTANLVSLELFSVILDLFRRNLVFFQWRPVPLMVDVAVVEINSSCQAIVDMASLGAVGSDSTTLHTQQPMATKPANAVSHRLGDTRECNDPAPICSDERFSRYLQVAICLQKLTPSIAVTGSRDLQREAAGHRVSTADALQMSSKSSDLMTSCSGLFKLRSPEHPLSHHLVKPEPQRAVVLVCSEILWQLPEGPDGAK